MGESGRRFRGEVEGGVCAHTATRSGVYRGGGFIHNFSRFPPDVPSGMISVKLCCNCVLFKEKKKKGN